MTDAINRAVYAMRDTQGWGWQTETILGRVQACEGEYLGWFVRYYDSGHYLTTERDGARIDWEAQDVTFDYPARQLSLFDAEAKEATP